MNLGDDLGAAVESRSCGERIMLRTHFNDLSQATLSYFRQVQQECL